MKTLWLFRAYSGSGPNMQVYEGVIISYLEMPPKEQVPHIALTLRNRGINMTSLEARSSIKKVELRSYYKNNSVFIIRKNDRNRIRFVWPTAAAVLTGLLILYLLM